MPVQFKPKAAPKEAVAEDKGPPFDPDPEAEAESPNPLKKRKKKVVEEPEPSEDPPDPPKKDKVVFGKQGNATSEVKHVDGSEEHATEKVGGFIVSQSPMATVSVNASATLNMGNYESLRIGCMVTLPCDPATLDDTYATAEEFVEAKMDELIAKHGPSK